MTWSDVTREPTPRVIRQFAVLCLVACIGMGLVEGLARSRPAWGWAFGILGVACLAAGLWAPAAFRWIYSGALLVAFPIGFVVAQILLAVLFFGVFWVVAAFLRLGGRDAMVRRRQPSGKSYWEAKSAPADLKRYLRQY